VALHREALPGEWQKPGVDLVAELAELAGALVREADVLDRRDRQRLLARGHPVAAQPGCRRLGFLDHGHRDLGQAEGVDRVDLGGERRGLGAGADDEDVAVAHRSS
jgi:hypothetical protein